MTGIPELIFTFYDNNYLLGLQYGEPDFMEKNADCPCFSAAAAEHAYKYAFSRKNTECDWTRSSSKTCQTQYSSRFTRITTYT